MNFNPWLTFAIYNRYGRQEKYSPFVYFRLGQDPKGFGSLEKLKDKKAFFEGLAEAFYEVMEVAEGTKKPDSFEDLLNEL